MKGYFKWLGKQEEESDLPGIVTVASIVVAAMIYAITWITVSHPLREASEAQWKMEQQCYEVPGRTFLYKKTSGKMKGSRHLVTYKCRDGFYQRTVRSYDY